MPGPAGSNALAVTRITAIYEEVLEENDRPGRRIWSERIPDTPAEDEEIMARIGGQVVAAAIIENDQAAPIISDEPVRLTQTEIPKLKHGLMISETQIKLFRRIGANLATTRERNVFDDYVANALRRLREGVLDRKELMLNAMLTNSFSYDKYGIKISGVTWKQSAPANVVGHAVVTPAVLWSNVNSTPIADTLALKEDMSFTFGEEYNRVTMSTQTLKYIIATNEFKSLEFLFRPQGPFPTTVNLPAANYEYMRPIVGAMLGLEIELSDRRTHEEDSSGTRTQVRFLPQNAVVLTESSDYGDRSIWDWGNGIVTETLPGIIPNIVGGDFAGESYGPVAYTTAADSQGNPPGWVLWSVASGMPRLHRETASAVIWAW